MTIDVKICIDDTTDIGVVLKSKEKEILPKPEFIATIPKKITSAEEIIELDDKSVFLNCFEATFILTGKVCCRNFCPAPKLFTCKLTVGGIDFFYPWPPFPQSQPNTCQGQRCGGGSHCNICDC